MPEEIQGITRASAEDVYKFIEDDLKAAADALPKRSEYAATDMGRATSGAALGLLGKVDLYQVSCNERYTAEVSYQFEVEISTQEAGFAYQAVLHVFVREFGL